MSSRWRGELSEEDRIVWAMVAKTAKPLKGKAVPLPAPAQVEAAPMEKLLSTAPEPVLVQASEMPVRKEKSGAHPFDKQTHDKLLKGRLPIEARVDLHGMTQNEAHGLLLSFLHRAHAGDLRYVLVITGKGTSFGSEGALKRAVPAWLSTPLFRALVNGHDSAARQHGGAGALYVRLRRRNESRLP
jgi:DNA-nicking Smr family endonuclease